MYERCMAYLTAHQEEGIRGAAACHGYSGHDLEQAIKARKAKPAKVAPVADERARAIKMAERHGCDEVADYLRNPDGYGISNLCN